ncbi:MAG: CHASE2 domain-containing protein [Rhizobiales bacterium]|nr:CHASE2 domain-containing protein [Hyphomicrobiales bacterium]
MSIRAIYVVVALLLVLGLSLLRLADPAPLERARFIAFDLLQNLAPRTPDPNHPVRIVDVDQASLAAIGRWPWPRDVLARLIEKLDALGAKVIAFDFVFPDAEADPIEALGQSLKSDPAALSLLRQLPRLESGDAAFAAAMAGRKVVLGAIGRAGRATGAPVRKSGFALLGRDPVRHLPHFGTVTANLASLTEAAAGLGAVNWIPEHDQIVRKVPLVIAIAGEPFPSLTAEALRLASGETTISIRSSSASGEDGLGLEVGITSMRIGPYRVATDRHGQALIAFSESDPERYRSAAAVLDGTVPADDIAGRIVLVGTSAPGLFDLRATPMDSVVPGVEVHAQAIEQILAGHALSRPDYATGMELTFSVVMSLLLALFAYRTGAFATAVIGLITVTFVLSASWIAYQAFGLLFDSVFPILSATVVYLVATALLYFTTERERNRVRRAFSHYMAPSLVERLTREPGRLKLGGETRELTVLFSDVRGFTRIAEGYRENPADLIVLMNRLLTPLTNAITERGGTIDKYMGDAIMAFWNAPLDDEQHAANGCRSALEMVARLDMLNGERRAEASGQVAQGALEPLRLGIGLATGAAIVGNMGSELRFDYSALGDAVNLASRLESLSVQYGVRVLISDETHLRGAAGLAVVEVDVVRVKGRAEAVRIWTLVGGEALHRDARFASVVEGFDEALRLYRNRDWVGARARYLELAKASGAFELDELALCFARRCARFEEAPPPPDWDGVWGAESK